MAALPPAPRGRSIVTQNYGEAGAIDRFGGPLGLPAAYSGHNGFGLWGPPRGSEGSVIAVGLRRRTLLDDFTGCRRVMPIMNHAGIDNEEHGRLIAVCGAPRAPWPVLWRSLRHLS